jgi:hypothetical protein
LGILDTSNDLHNQMHTANTMMTATMNRKSAGIKIGSLIDIRPPQTVTEAFTPEQRNAHARAIVGAFI